VIDRTLDNSGPRATDTMKWGWEGRRQNRRQQLDIQLAMYNVRSTVNFPTRVFNVSCTAMIIFSLIYQEILLPIS
jgi:hypothetical protein